MLLPRLYLISLLLEHSAKVLALIPLYSLSISAYDFIHFLPHKQISWYGGMVWTHIHFLCTSLSSSNIPYPTQTYSLSNLM